MPYSVAIVDDERVVREGMAAVVSSGGTGFELAGTATNGEEGLELVRATRPSLLVTDIRMPRMDGLEMVEALRREDSDVRVAIVTGFDDSAYARAALRFGVGDYLLKPVLPSAFRELLESVRADLDREALRSRDAEDLRTRAEAALPAAKERRVRELLEGRAQADAAGDGLLGIRLEGTVFCAAILKFPAADEEGLRWAADAARAAFGSTLDVYPAAVSADSAALLLVARAGDERRAYLAASSGGRRLRAAAEERFGAPTTFALGGVRSAADGIPGSFAEARDALASVFGEGEGRLVAYGDLAAEPLCAEPRTAELEASVLAAVKLGSAETAETAARGFVGSLGESCGSYREERLKSRVVACLSAIDLALPPDAHRPVPPVVAAVSASTLRELADIAASYAAGCAAAVARSRAGRAADIVERARIVAERRMSDESLGLDDIAAELFVSPSHLRHVFKRQTGMTFCDFLGSLRLDAAFRLLGDPDLKIQDIARMVGYAEQRYFASCFKRKFGMTPSERRERRSDDAAVHR